MSNYYDDGPFKLSQWNKMLTDLNAKFTNPPSGCTAISPLPLASDPHPWTVQDVRDVRDAMQQSCPDISFSAPLEKWLCAILDEIESQMSKIWCNCSGGGGGGGWGPCVNHIQSRSVTAYQARETVIVTDNLGGQFPQYYVDIFYRPLADSLAEVAAWESTERAIWEANPGWSLAFEGPTFTTRTGTETRPC